MSLLRLKSLTVRYNGAAVVDDVSFAISRGESVGLVGESGSGKTQTALALLGLLPRNAELSGSIRFAGTEISGLSQRQLDAIRATRIGMVFQDPMQALNPYLRVGKQLREIVLRHNLATGDAADESVIAMLRRVGLPDPERQSAAFPHQLSGGMRQRVMIASALIAEPDLLIADEPTTALDVTVQAQILDLLEELRDDTALLLITHDLGIVAGRCERLLVLDSGRLVESGPTGAVFAAPQNPHTEQLLSRAPRVDRGDFLQPVEPRTVLAVDGAAVRYADAGRHSLHAVQDVSLSLNASETLAIVGESGSGKSSLVRALLGLMPLHAGKIVYAGEALPGDVDARSARVRRDLQLVFQDPVSALNPQMRVQDIVQEPLQVHEPGETAQARLGRVVSMLKKVGLDDRYLHRYPHQLSGGQAQRVAIARALILEPKVLICDEPVTALDSAARQQVLDVLRAAQQASGLAIIFISHDLAVVRSISHRVAVMYLGRLVEVAAAANLFVAPKHPYTRALLNASPIPDPLAVTNVAALKGEVPSPMSPPGGCVFHPRCDFADSGCSDSRPELRDLDGAHVACHLAGTITV